MGNSLSLKELYGIMCRRYGELARALGFEGDPEFGDLDSRHGQILSRAHLLNPERIVGAAVRPEHLFIAGIAGSGRSMVAESFLAKLGAGRKATILTASDVGSGRPMPSLNAETSVLVLDDCLDAAIAVWSEKLRDFAENDGWIVIVSLLPCSQEAAEFIVWLQTHGGVRLVTVAMGESLANRRSAEGEPPVGRVGVA